MGYILHAQIPKLHVCFYTTDRKRESYREREKEKSGAGIKKRPWNRVNDKRKTKWLLTAPTVQTNCSHWYAKKLLVGGETREKSREREILNWISKQMIQGKLNHAH